MGFLINSKINKWIQRDPKRMASQAKLAAIEHRILDHDSWVDCIDLYPFTDDELTSERGRVSDRGIAQIRQAVSNSETIVSRYKAMILKTRKK